GQGDVVDLLAVGLVAVGGEAGRAEAQSVTVGLGAVGGGDRQRPRIDGVRAVDVRDVVVRQAGAAADGGDRRDDGVRADRGRGVEPLPAVAVTAALAMLKSLASFELVWLVSPPKLAEAV